MHYAEACGGAQWEGAFPLPGAEDGHLRHFSDVSGLLAYDPSAFNGIWA